MLGGGGAKGFYLLLYAITIRTLYPLYPQSQLVSFMSFLVTVACLYIYVYTCVQLKNVDIQLSAIELLIHAWIKHVVHFYKMKINEQHQGIK